MGPSALFDKSFLQSLTADESVWFDHFFTAVVCPLFYVETLADLEKAVRADRTPEDEVGIIAGKFPEMGAMPCIHHATAALGELLGHPVPMTGQIPMSGGDARRDGDRTGFVFEPSSESQAFSRWRDRQFLELERGTAKRWREMLSSIDLRSAAEALKKDGRPVTPCKSLAEAKAVASALVDNPAKPHILMNLLLDILEIRPEHRRQVLERWSIAGYQRLRQYAPYCAHVATVEVFFRLALSASLISPGRPTNRVDVSYLYYLPFCNTFISSDRLHRSCAPLFIRDDQMFAWGPDLKSDLGRLNRHYLELPETTRDAGIMTFARSPPADTAPLVAQVWDHTRPGWRANVERPLPPLSEEMEKKLVNELTGLEQARAIADEEVHESEHPSMIVKRSYRRRKGSWYQVPKNLKNEGS
jgi:hypothetical protein